MQARIKNPAMVITDAMPMLVGLGKLLGSSPIPAKTRGLIHVRTSQINGCAFCLDLEMSHTTETAQRLGTVAAWRDSPYFSEAERAALGLAEAMTRMADHADAVPDDVWAEAARHYDETALAWLVLDVGLMNLYNRMNVATRQVPGSHRF